MLATHLGYEAPRQIRELIKRNIEELEGFGGVVQRDTLASGNRTAAYYLNRQQALLICILSKTEKAKEVRADVIHIDSEGTPRVGSDLHPLRRRHVRPEDAQGSSWFSASRSPAR